MKRYALRQLVQLAVVIVGISMLAFAILHVIGDPVTLLLPQNAGKEEFERYRKLLGEYRVKYDQIRGNWIEGRIEEQQRDLMIDGLMNRLLDDIDDEPDAEGDAPASGIGKARDRDREREDR